MRAFASRQLTKTLAVLAHPGNQLFLRQIGQHPQRMNPPKREGLCLCLRRIENRDGQGGQCRCLFARWNHSEDGTRRSTSGKADSHLKVAADGDASRDADRPNALHKTPSQHLRWSEETLSAAYVDPAEECRILASLFNAR